MCGTTEKSEGEEGEGEGGGVVCVREGVWVVQQYHF